MKGIFQGTIEESKYTKERTKKIRNDTSEINKNCYRANEGIANDLLKELANG